MYVNVYNDNKKHLLIQDSTAVNTSLLAACYIYLPDVLQRLSIHHTVEFGGRGFRPGTAWSRVGLGWVLSLLLVFEHLWVLDDGGGKLSLGARYSETLAVDVLVDAVLYVTGREGRGLVWVLDRVKGGRTASKQKLNKEEERSRKPRLILII